MKPLVSARFRSGDRGGGLRRLVFCVLLCVALAEPRIGSNAFEYPAVTSAWALLPFGLLIVLPVADLGRPWRLINIDLGMLLLPVVAVAFEKVPRQWPVLLVYISLGYLGSLAVSELRLDRTLRQCARTSLALLGDY